jgi:hypothetical protein
MDHDISSLSRLGMAMLLLIGAVVRAPTLTAADSVDADVLEAQQRRIDAIQRGLPAAVSIFAGEAGGGAGVLISRLARWEAL